MIELISEPDLQSAFKNEFKYRIVCEKCSTPNNFKLIFPQFCTICLSRFNFTGNVRYDTIDRLFFCKDRPRIIIIK